MTSTLPSTRVLVVGGTGRAGRAAVRALLEAGAAVRVLARRSRPLPAGAELVLGDVTDDAAVLGAIAGVSGVHIALAGGPTAASYEAIEAGGTRRLVAAARSAGVRMISLLSGSTTAPEHDFYEGTRAKLAAERTVRESGLPHRVVRASWLFESLPDFVRDGRATVIGKVPTAYHWVSAEDIGRALAAAHLQGAGENGVAYAYGPQTLTIEEALRRYVAVVAPHAKVRRVPARLLGWIGTLSGKPELTAVARLMRYFERAGAEPEGVPTLPAPTTLDQYLAACAAAKVME